MSEQARPLEAMSAETATAMLSAAHQVTYEVVGPLTGGETGATEIRRSDGVRFVLKWETDTTNQLRRRDGALLAERLRTEAQWPSPTQELVDVDGTLLIVQEFLEGHTVEHLSHALIDRVMALHHSRLSMPVGDGPAKWGPYLLRILVQGGNAYCLHEPLRAFDPRTRRVVERIEEIGRSTDPNDLASNDIIHYDLHPGNLLQDDGRLTAVVDMDYTRIGDAAFDLTTLAVSSLGISCDRGVRTRLLECGVWSLSDEKRRVYVANLLLRNLDWAIRKSRLAEVEFWLAQTERLLTD